MAAGPLALRGRAERAIGAGLRTPVPFLGALLLAFLIVPVIAFLLRLAGAGRARLSSPGTGHALLVSVQTATIATAVALLLGVPLAYLLARGRSRTSTTVGMLVQMPLALPPLMSGILLLYVVGPYTTIGRAFGGHLTDDRTGIVLAQLFVAAPFLVIAARSSFAALDPALDDVAATLGLSRWSRFITVAVPAAMPGIAAGLALTWLRAFGEFGATVVLAYHPYSLPVLTYVQFGSAGLDATMLPTAVALGAALVVVLLLGGGRRLASTPRSRPVLPSPRPPSARTARALRFELRGQVGSFTSSVATRTPSCRLALIGASGAGKTFVLRMLAGLVATASGLIDLGGSELAAVPAAGRGVGYVPQDAVLFPRLDVWRQVTAGRGCDPALAVYWLDRLGILDLVERRPDQLSGGQRRRVALVRALAREPLLLLLDEPFSGLDASVRDDFRRQLASVQRESGITTVLVTHDPTDVVHLADDVVVIEDGAIVQQGPVDDLRNRPVSSSAAELLGVRNVMTGEVVRSGQVSVANTVLSADTGSASVGSAVHVRVSPRGLRIGAAEGITAVLVSVADLDTHVECELLVADGSLLIAAVGALPIVTPGEETTLSVDAAAITCWPVSADSLLVPHP